MICRQVLDWTGDESVAEISHWALDVPLRIAVIVIGALVINWLLRRAIGKGLRRLNSGAMEERFGAVRRGMPGALHGDRETSLRAEQRIEALTGVLRSLTSFVVWLIAAFMMLGELGINLAPLLAGAGMVGVALGFGSQSLVKDFLSGIFILVEDQFGVGDIVDLDGQDDRHGRGGQPAHDAAAQRRRHRLARAQRRDPPGRQHEPALVALAAGHRSRLRHRHRAGQGA